MYIKKRRYFTFRGTLEECDTNNNKETFEPKRFEPLFVLVEGSGCSFLAKSLGLE